MMRRATYSITFFEQFNNPYDDSITLMFFFFSTAASRGPSIQKTFGLCMNARTIARIKVDVRQSYFLTEPSFDAVGGVTTDGWILLTLVDVVERCPETAAAAADELSLPPLPAVLVTLKKNQPYYPLYIMRTLIEFQPFKSPSWVMFIHLWIAWFFVVCLVGIQSKKFNFETRSLYFRFCHWTFCASVLPMIFHLGVAPAWFAFLFNSFFLVMMNWAYWTKRYGLYMVVFGTPSLLQFFYAQLIVLPDSIASQ